MIKICFVYVYLKLQPNTSMEQSPILHLTVFNTVIWLFMSCLLDGKFVLTLSSKYYANCLIEVGLLLVKMNLR